MATINGRRINTSEVTTTLQNAAGATGNGTALTFAPEDQMVTIKALGASTPSMTVVFELSYDSGSTWENAFPQNILSTTAAFLNTLVITDTTAARYVWIRPPGATNFRARVSVFVSGTVTVSAITLRGV